MSLPSDISQADDTVLNVAHLMRFLAENSLGTKEMKIGSNQVPYRCFLRTGVSRDPGGKRVTLLRFFWANGEPGKPGGGHTAKLSIGLQRKLFQWVNERTEGWILVLLGVRLHLKRSYGGWMV